jgi:hypothetical protein
LLTGDRAVCAAYIHGSSPDRIWFNAVSIFLKKLDFWQNAWSDWLIAMIGQRAAPQPNVLLADFADQLEPSPATRPAPARIFSRGYQLRKRALVTGASC